MKDKEFPNGFTSWQECHFDVVTAINCELDIIAEQSYNDEPQGIVAIRQHEQGSGGIYELAQELTDEFESKFKGVEWGVKLEYYEEIENFLNEKLK